jgi:hypothetical protein|tara:strand:- start:663 stop:860 length:198 start_codon:yes stop_codon:yes gene_type:complete
MCLICLEFQKGNLTLKEAWNNYSEMVSDIEEKHKQELEGMLLDAEKEQEAEEEQYNFFSFDWWED